MPRVKAPAYQWYPRDYMADAVVQSMTQAQEGAYRRLMDHCWLENGLPTSLDELWVLAKAPSLDAFARDQWPLISRKFYEKRGRLHQRRLDQERAKQAKTRKVRQLAAQKMHAKKGRRRDANATRLQCLSTTPSTTSSSATAVVPRTARGKVFVGVRLTVSQKQHDVVVQGLGGDAGHVDWMRLYVDLDQALADSGEAFDTLVAVRQRAQDAVKALRRGGPLFSSPEPDVDWFEECRQLHQGTCGGRVRHHAQRQIDAAKAAAS